MERRSQFALLLTLVALAGCSSSVTTQSDSAPKQPDSAPVPSAPAEQTSGQTPKPVAKASPIAAPSPSQKFSKPIVRQTGSGLAAVPGLLQPTNVQMRLSMVSAGRRNPFAATRTAPIWIGSYRPVAVNRPNSRLPQLPALPAVPIASNAPLLPPLPIAAAPNNRSLPPLPSLPSNSGTTSAPPVGSPPLSPINIPVAPVSPTALADAIEVTGVVQVRGKWYAIVREPNASSSRYVTTGERLANGQVLVKRIIAGIGADPIVVLVQNGIELRKAIGVPVALLPQ